MSWNKNYKKYSILGFLLCSTIACHGATTAPFVLTLDEGSESDFQTDFESEDGNSSEIENETEFNSDLDRRDTQSETEHEFSTNVEQNSDTSEQNADSTEHESFPQETETTNASDSDSEFLIVTDSGSISDADTESATDTDVRESDDETQDCPGSCQYNRISSEELKDSGLTAGFYIDPSVSSYFLCDNGTETMGYETYPVYSGWIRDNSFDCPGIGLYCCRPQTVYDRYCTDFGGTCEPSGHPAEGPGFCAFASNECVLGDTQ